MNDGQIYETVVFGGGHDRVPEPIFVATPILEGAALIEAQKRFAELDAKGNAFAEANEGKPKHLHKTLTGAETSERKRLADIIQVSQEAASAGHEMETEFEPLKDVVKIHYLPEEQEKVAASGFENGTASGMPMPPIRRLAST